MPDMDFEGKHFTLDEAQSLLPVLEALLKRAIDAKNAVEEIQEEMQALSRRIFLAGGMFLDVDHLRRRRAALDSHLQQVKDSLAEIEAIGVQIKDLDTGLLDFPCFVDGETVLLCWKMGEERIGFWHTLDAGFRGRQPVDDRFKAKKNKPERPN
ncbi:MAG TPA: DUF2203 domain-containing protein [Acidobacteriaceae bacterium]|nr:DUF2203 domain-containing protein [Acidobacteriaceae bacterium]